MAENDSSYPVDESSLGVEEIEFVVQSGPCGSDSVFSATRLANSRCGVRQHAEGSGYLGQISAGNERGGLVADTKLRISLIADVSVP